MPESLHFSQWLHSTRWHHTGSPPSKRSTNRPMTSSFGQAMQTLRNLASSSNRAATHIVNGQYLQAFSTVRSASSEARSLAPLIAECQATEYIEDPAYQIKLEPLSNGFCPIIENVDDFVFCCPFLTRHRFEVSSARSIVNLRHIKIISAVAISNMALACHLQFHIADECRKAEALSRRARSLYAQAAKLLEESHSVHRHHSVVLLYLAVCNNLVQLYLSEGNLDRVKDWKAKFEASMQTMSTDDDSWLMPYFVDLQVMYTGSFICARVA